MRHETFIDRLSRRIGEAVCWLFLVAAVLTCYEVVVDSVFDSPTIWVHDSTIMLCSIAFVFGGAYAMQRREHIRITVVYDLLGPRVRWVCDLVSLVLALTYLGALAVFTGMQAVESIRLVERSGRAWDFPMPMVIRTALFLGAALLVLQALSAFYAHLTHRDAGHPFD